MYADAPVQLHTISLKASHEVRNVLRIAFEISNEVGLNLRERYLSNFGWFLVPDRLIKHLMFRALNTEKDGKGIQQIDALGRFKIEGLQGFYEFIAWFNFDGFILAMIQLIKGMIPFTGPLLSGITTTLRRCI